jgi:hypothetical protein
MALYNLASGFLLVADVAESFQNSQLSDVNS